MTPRRRNVCFYATPAAAQEAGFRACKRCRPDAAPGSPDWDSRADVVARAVRLIGDGAIEREGVDGLARRIGYSPRHLSRLLSAELGTGPLRLAVAHRVQAARTLLETSELSVTDVAWAAGFGSIRQFNDVIRRVYAMTPAELRDRAAERRDSKHSEVPPAKKAGPEKPAGPAATPLRARLCYRPPLAAAALLGFLGMRAVPGVESYDGSAYSTALRLPRGQGVARLSVAARMGRTTSPYLECELWLDDARDYPTAVSRLRRLLDLDADPRAVADGLSADPFLAPLVAGQPGRRMPGSADPEETALRAVIGQQVSLPSAQAISARLARRYGQALDHPQAGVTTVFPTAEALAAADPAGFGMPRARGIALRDLAAAMADGSLELHPGVDRDRVEARLLERRGIGPWAAAYIRMRGLGDPDVLPPGDAALRRSGAYLQNSRRWRPWRSYATAYLWASAGPRSSPAEKAPACPPKGKSQ